MSHICRITNNGTQTFLVSKEYVDLRLQAIKDSLLAHENDVNSAHTKLASNIIQNGGLLDKEEIIDLNLAQNTQKLLANMIEQDPQHRFVSDTQIQVFKDKVSMHDVETIINDAKSEIKSNFNELYVRLLNMPNAVETLKTVSELLKYDVNIKSLCDVLNLKVSDADFDEHVNSNKHLTNNDRKALNILLGYISNGTMQKIDSIGEHANSADISSDSNKLNGKTADQLKQCHIDTNIYGTQGSGYDDNAVDAIINKDNINEIFNGMIKKCGIISFKPGCYIIKDLNLNRFSKESELIINGSGNSTIFVTESAVFNNITLENITIEPENGKTRITINSNVKIKDTVFNNCEIVFNASQRLLIKNCTFKNCTFTFSDPCAFMNISDNFFINGRLGKYLSRNNVITNNIEI